jgi:outer membrane protein
VTFKISLAALTVAASAVLGQTPSKVGVINIQQAIVSTKDGQKAAQDLQARFEPKSKEIEKRAADLQGLQQQYQKSSNTASEDQRARMAREIDQKQKALQRDNEDARAEIEQEQQKIINELGGRIMQVIDKYARDNAYTLILDVSSPQTPVLYMATGIDVTADIVKLYDANAPAPPPAAPAAKPAAMPTSAPKPAAAKPKP